MWLEMPNKILVDCKIKITSYINNGAKFLVIQWSDHTNLSDSNSKTSKQLTRVSGTIGKV